MSRRKGWNLDLLSGETAGLMLLSAMFLLGSAAGSIAAGLMDGEEQSALAEYIRSYLALLSQDGVRPPLVPLMWEVLRFPLLALLFGFTALGVVGMPVLFAVRGFLLSFAISAFYHLFGLTGELPAFLIFGLSALIWMPVLFHLGVQGFWSAYGLLRRSMGDGRYPLPYNYRYLARCGLCAGGLAVCVGVEYAAVPALMQAAAGVL